MEFEFEVFIPESVKNLCEIGKLLHRVNQKKHFVKSAEFYNEGISNNIRPIETIDSFYKKQKILRKNKKKNRNEEPNFTLCDYPFFLNCFFKQ